jgi:hypothetical protein
VTAIEKRRLVLLVRDDLAKAIAAATRAGVPADDLERADEALEHAWSRWNDATPETNRTCVRLLLEARDLLKEVVSRLERALR